MKKVKVYIEEHLCKEVEIEVPDNLNVDERIELAEEKAREMYRNEEIILTSDDYTTTLVCAFDMETDISTEWNEI